MENKPSGDDFDKMARLAQSVLLDYGLYVIPIYVYALADKMGIRLIPYSSLTAVQLECLLRKAGTERGFTVAIWRKGRMTFDVYYNDDYTEAACRFTIAHEIKHIVSGDIEKNEREWSKCDEILADYFAKCLLAPQAIIIYLKLSTPDQYMLHFGLSKQAALRWWCAVEKRKEKFGESFLFKEEIDFLLELGRRFSKRI